VRLKRKVLSVLLLFKDMKKVKLEWNMHSIAHK